MACLSKAQILAAADISFETVDVPEWGGEVRLKEWAVAQADNVAALLASRNEIGIIPNWRQQIVALSIVDEDGAVMFTADDIESLGAKSTAAMNRVFKAAMTLNKLGSYDDAAEDGEGDKE